MTLNEFSYALANAKTWDDVEAVNQQLRLEARAMNALDDLLNDGLLEAQIESATSKYYLLIAKGELKSKELEPTFTAAQLELIMEEIESVIFGHRSDLSNAEYKYSSQIWEALERFIK